MSQGFPEWESVRIVVPAIQRKLVTGRKVEAVSESERWDRLV